MGLYDTFDNFMDQVKVKCYIDIGGAMNVYKKGDVVPTVMLDSDFEQVADYGQHYNIFDHNNTKLVVIVRYGIFVDIKNVNDLISSDTNGYLCIDVLGNQIEDVDSVSDYKLILKQSLLKNKGIVVPKNNLVNKLKSLLK